MYWFNVADLSGLLSIILRSGYRQRKKLPISIFWEVDYKVPITDIKYSKNKPSLCSGSCDDFGANKIHLKACLKHA